MRTINLLACLILGSIGLAAQAPPPVIGGQFFGFDYQDADLASAAVVRFEMQIDSGTWTTVGIPSDTLPITGGKTYKVPVPAITPGNHTVTFRACNVDLCGGAASPFAFKFVIVPALPTNIRIVGG